MESMARRCLAAGCMAVAAVAFTNGAAWAAAVSEPSPVQKAAPARIQQAPTMVRPALAPSAGEKIYMTIAGVSGDGPGGKVVCRSLRVGQGAPRDVATGQASGRRTHSQVVITKQVDKASPTLMQATVTGRVLDSVVFEFVRVHTDAKGAEQTSTTKTTKLTRAMISSVRQIGGGNVPQEEVTFTAERIENP